MILLPHGGYPLIPATLSAMAWISYLSQDGCDYARLEGPSTAKLGNQEGDYDAQNIPFAEIGFSHYRVPIYDPSTNTLDTLYSGACVDYDFIDDWRYDLTWRIGSTFHKMAGIIGGTSCIVLFVTAICITLTKLQWNLVGIMTSIASICHAISLLWFTNNLCGSEGNGCQLFYGSISSILGSCLTGVAAISMFVKYPEPKVLKYVRRTLEEDYQNFERVPLTDVESDDGSER
mmetsp:Transcript_186/g.282  ORF Transcript_186/g.282 Transcript_186/m.282 type:complete len:232 (-) Transcript_186:764-1459(-)